MFNQISLQNEQEKAHAKDRKNREKEEDKISLTVHAKLLKDLTHKRCET